MTETLDKDRTHIAELGGITCSSDSIRHSVRFSSEVVLSAYACAVCPVLPFWVEVRQGVAHPAFGVMEREVMTRGLYVVIQSPPLLLLG